MQRHGSGGHPVAGCDLGECAGGPVGEAVVVEHDPGPVEVQWTEHPVRQLGHHVGDRAGTPRAAGHRHAHEDRTGPGGFDNQQCGRMFECMLDQSVSEHRPERCPNGHVYVDSAGSG